MRKCSKCGHECADDVAFCTACGNPMNAAPEAPAEAAAPAEPAQEAPKAVETEAAPKAEGTAAPKKPIAILEKFKAMSNKSKIMLGGICAVALLLIIGIICLIGSLGKKDYRVNKDAISLIYDSDQEAYYVINGRGQHKKVASEITLTEVSWDSNCKTIVVKDEDKNYYILTIKGLTKFAEDIESVELCTDGSAVAFIDDSDDDDVLKVYTVKSKKTVTITKDATNRFVLSNNGKHITYIVKDDDERVAYVARNLKTKVKIGKNATPIAVSDNGKLVYFSEEVTDKKSGDTSDALCLLNGSKKVTITKDFNATTLYFNKNMTQVVFHHDEKIRISVNGKTPVALAKGSLSAIAANCETLYDATTTGFRTRTMKIGSFAGTLLVTNDTVYRIKNLKTATKVLNMENCSVVGTTPNYNALMYYKNGDLYLMPNIKNPDRTKKVADFSDYDIDDFYPAANLKSFYFTTDDDELFFVKNGGKPKLVAEDVSIMGYDYLKDTIYYFVDHSSGDADMLYGSKNGAKNKKVLKNAVNVDETDGDVPIGFRENAKDDDYSDLFILDGYRTKNLKVKTEVRTGNIR